MEQPLLAASLRSRQDFELIRQYIDMRGNTYSKPFQIVMTKVGDYYKRDGDAQFVLADVLLAQVAETIRNEKHVQRFKDLVEESLATSGSDINVRAVVLMAKQQEIADKVAQALATDSSNPRCDALIEELRQLRAMTSLDELENKGLEAFTNINILELVERQFNPEGLIQIYPKSLNDRLDGGLHGEHHLVVFGQIELGKTAVSINISCGGVRQGKRSMYVINEDSNDDIKIRHVSNLSGMNKYEIRDNPKRAQELADAQGFQNLIVINADPGSPEQIERAIEEHNPDLIIVDQLRNLQVKAESRVNQLEMAATSVRNIGKRAKKVIVSVTQAGDSATNKLILDKGDIDFSNVGIPAQADVLLGIGMDPTFEAEGLRNFTLCKNKISGCHDNFPVRIVPQLSRILSV